VAETAELGFSAEEKREEEVAGDEAGTKPFNLFLKQEQVFRRTNSRLSWRAD